MIKKPTLAMAMLSLGIAVQAQNALKLSTGKVKPEITASVQQKHVNSKFGMELQQYLASGKASSQRKMAGAGAAQPTVSVMVMLQPSAGITAEALESAGCKVNWSMKSQAFVTVPVNNLDRLADVHGVLGINLPQTYQLHNNNSREATNVSTVSDPVSAVAAGLPQAYDGSGVIVGVLDTGIDYAHPAFRNADGSTRIKCAITYREDQEQGKIWRYVDFDPEKILSIEPITNKTHGSHTMGTAAGSNTGNDLQGMAPGADLVPADLFGLYDNLLIDGLRNICEYANYTGQPVVTNFSIGSPGAFRDGCDAISQAFIELTEDGTKPGVIFSVSAGNSGDYEAYVHHTFTSDNEKLYVMMDIPSKLYELETEDGIVNVHKFREQELLSGFADKNVDNAEEMLVAYSLNEQRILDGDEEIGAAVLYKTVTEDGESIISILPFEGSENLGLYIITLNDLRVLLANVDGYSQNIVHNCSDGVTQKRKMVYTIIKDMSIMLFEDVRLGGCFSMPAGTHLTVANHANGQGGKLIKPEGFDYVVAGTPDGCINESACNMANITVGSYNVLNTFTGYFGDEKKFNNPLGEVTFFSSYGYTNDGNDALKPDVLAPGSYLLSAVNGNYSSYFSTYGELKPKEEIKDPEYLGQKIEFDGKTYWYEYMQGTSMAAPVVTGIIALWLQAAPSLSVRDIREIIAKTSVPYLGDDPVQSGMYGKIDALAGLRYITDEVTGIDCITYPQTANTTDTRIFTLDGREVKGTPSHGIYVVGGKKVVK